MTVELQDQSNTPDALQLETLQARIRLLRDRVRSVANRYQTAAYIVGRPGVGKTYTVLDELHRRDWAPWAVRNARMTPLGLFRFFAEHPDRTLVLDDVGGLFDNRAALLILLAALDGRPDVPREITYQTKTNTDKLMFRGGVIAISNLPLRNDPIAKALGNRIVILEHEPSDAEVAAFMRHLVEAGYQGLTPDDGREVVDFLIGESRRCDIRLDLRSLAKSTRDYLQFRDGHADTPWRELVRSTLRKLADAELVPLISKHQEIEQQRERVRQLVEMYPNDAERQRKESGLKKSTFYSRRREVLLGR